MNDAADQSLTADVRADILRLLASQSTAVLATTGSGGGGGSAEPWVTPLFFCFEWEAGLPLRLYWLSSPESRHSRALPAPGGARAAIAVYPQVWTWPDIQGLQMEGVALPVADPAQRARVLEAYRQRFRLDADLDPLLEQATLYEFRPAWLRYLDNRRGFGFRVEVRLADHAIY